MNTPLPHDPVLPHLATALDGAAMARVFGAALVGSQVLRCEVDRIKYRPRRNCSVSYCLQVLDARHGAFEQRVAARFCSGGDAQRRHRQAAALTLVASAAGPALQHVPALDMLAFWLPNDAKLGALRLLCDEIELRRRCLHEVVAALTGGRGELVDHRTALLQVVPELRACARVELQLRREPGAALSMHTLYVKANIERSGAAAQALMQALSDSPAQTDGRLYTPQSILWQEAAGLHWQQALPGHALADFDPTVGAAASAHVGRQLAALHATPVPSTSRPLGVASLCEQSAKAADLLGCVEPGWQPLLARLVDRLDAGAAWIDCAAPATLHGDLHPRNILVDRQAGAVRHAFIDLDDVHAGPAPIELGGWVADAHYRALLDGLAPAEVAASCDAFLAAYTEASGERVDSAQLAWSAAHHLLCQRAYRAVANLKAGRFASIPALLAMADAIAEARSVDAAYNAAREAA